ncbi:MAG: DUF2254 domain-containing protein [Panacibacter sp.]
MQNYITGWMSNRYQKIVNSIAFYPALIALTFLLLSYGAVVFDFSDTGKQIKEQADWLSLRDASTARAIISAIVSGIISLTVFSFSMVMIVLNQTASQMSNRILDKLIGNRFQQIVLGIYIGTIVFALYLISTIRDVDSGIRIPALSTYVLILLTILDIFLFIYFLHYITQSVKYETIIQRIYKQTLAVMTSSCTVQEEQTVEDKLPGGFFIHTTTAGIYKGFNKQAILRICNHHDCTIQILVPTGSFILKGIRIIQVSKQLADDAAKDITTALFIDENNETIENNFFYGFRQLMEVAIKALSPGINDPGTAVESLRALSKLFVYHSFNYPAKKISNDQDRVVIITTERSLEEIFERSIMPIWDYGNKDRMIRRELKEILTQLRFIKTIPIVERLFAEVISTGGFKK